MTSTIFNQQIKRKTQIRPQNIFSSPMDMSRTATIILGGGQGTRLFPLTEMRCKPAISFGGKYRLIDIPMSNSINAGCLNIFIISQFLSSSLHRHILKTYRLGNFSSGFIELLAAEEKKHAKGWYQGTADAVRQNLDYFLEIPVDYFFILSGDQIYNMNLQKMMHFAKTTNADLVIASIPVKEKDARRMGNLKIDEKKFITNFHEKPQEQELLDKLCLCNSTLSQMGLPPSEDPYYLGSMGIYLFKRQALFDLLEKDNREDFGKHLIPTKVKEGNVAAYIHHGYWEDIGTIESFYNANMALTDPNPKFNAYDENNPIYSHHCNLPGSKLTNVKIKNSIICEGSIIEGSEITKSVLGPRTVIKKGTIVQGSYLMGNEFYTPPISTDTLPEKLQIGKNCFIRNCIIDQHAYIGNNVQLINKNNLNHFNSDDVYIRDGVIVVTKGACLPDGYTL